jgi:MinD-like ATPase involved in chromosome partitioning or flagellar assembly
MSTSLRRSRGRIYTFYSYKGGVGRSMALANVAVLLAKWGRRVLVLDWDLEAPGLERYFESMVPGVREKVGDQNGVIDIVDELRSRGESQWRDAVIRLAVPGSDDGQLDFISAGRRDSGYVERLQHLDWEALFRQHDFGNRLETIRNEWLEAYDHILIDSRTGVTDVGGICTIYLPDALVAIFSANHQSVEGVADVIFRARRARSGLPVDRGALICVPVPARDESRTEYQQSIEWRNIYHELFSELYVDFLPKNVSAMDALDLLSIPNVPFWSFGERLPVLTESLTDPSRISYYYTTLARLLANDLSWPDSALDGVAAVGGTVQVTQARTPRVAVRELGDPGTAPTKIRLWGPPNSGKTTYLAALGEADAPADRSLGRWTIYPVDALSQSLLAGWSHRLVTEHSFPSRTAIGETTQLKWLFAGNLAEVRHEKRWLRRQRTPDQAETRFLLDLVDVSGEAYGYDPGGANISPGIMQEAQDQLAGADGIIFLFDPITEREKGSAAQYLNTSLTNLMLRMHSQLIDNYLPQQVSVCVTKFDDPQLFDQARRLGLVNFGPDGIPRVYDQHAEQFFDALCDGDFWGERDTESYASAAFVRDQLRRAFRRDRIKYYVTSSIGFWVPPGGSPAESGRVGSEFDPHDFANTFVDPAGQDRIRGVIRPINVLEPLISLTQRLAGRT